jgi:hypothetical protein
MRSDSRGTSLSSVLVLVLVEVGAQLSLFVIHAQWFNLCSLHNKNVDPEEVHRRITKKTDLLSNMKF